MPDVHDVTAATNSVVDLNLISRARADLSSNIATAAKLAAQVIPIRSPRDAALAEIARLKARVHALESVNEMLRHNDAIRAQNIDRVVDDLKSKRPRSSSWHREVLLGERVIPLAPWRFV